MIGWVDLENKNLIRNLMWIFTQIFWFFRSKIFNFLYFFLKNFHFFTQNFYLFNSKFHNILVKKFLQLATSLFDPFSSFPSKKSKKKSHTKWKSLLHKRQEAEKRRKEGSKNKIKWDKKISSSYFYYFSPPNFVQLFLVVKYRFQRFTTI